MNPLKFALITCTFAVCGIHPLNAELSATNRLKKPVTDEQITKLPAVLVTAQNEEPGLANTYSSAALFGEKPLLDTPFSVSVVGQNTIEEQRAFTTAEVLKNVPSVYVAFPGSSYGYYDTFGIRGFDSHNWYSYRVDGMAFANQGENPIENKESVEVLKGAAALRYGFAPPGGVINYTRKKPTEQPYYAASVDVNTFGRTLGQVDLGGHFDQEKKTATESSVPQKIGRVFKRIPMKATAILVPHILIFR